MESTVVTADDSVIIIDSATDGVETAVEAEEVAESLFSNSPPETGSRAKPARKTSKKSGKKAGKKSVRKTGKKAGKKKAT